MKKNILILILLAHLLFSCKQGKESMKDKAEAETFHSVKNDPIKKGLSTISKKDIYTKYEYNDSKGASLIIQNSFPRGGMKYAGPNNEVYNYAVFWTRIINETDNILELKMDFPINSYEVPSLPGKYFKILVPPDTMVPEKAPLFNYGLTNLESFLDKNIYKAASLKRTINSKESTGFYVVMLCVIEGAKGTLRTGLSLNEKNLTYTINDTGIKCGSIIIKKTT